MIHSFPGRRLVFVGLDRPRVKGARLSKPRQAVEATPRRRRTTVAWYGGGARRVETTTGAGRWYKKGEGPVPVRWAFVHDRGGTHRDEFFYATDPVFDVRRIVETDTGRWNIETTSQETRSELHIQATRGRSKPTVLRAVPCLFGLYSVVAMLYAALTRERRVGGVAWPGKAVVASSDALAAVRRWIWAQGVFAHAPDGPSLR